MTLKEKLSDYTEQEFLGFLYEIDRANDNEPDNVLPLYFHTSEKSANIPLEWICYTAQLQNMTENPSRC